MSMSSSTVSAMGYLLERRHIRYLLAVGTDKEDHYLQLLDWTRASFVATQKAEIRETQEYIDKHKK